MIITYHKRALVKVSLGDTTLAFNPLSKDGSEKPVKFGADLVFVAIDHPHYNGVDNATYGDRAPFVVDGPGEYEVNDVFVRGVGTLIQLGAQSYINSIFTVRLEDITLCHLGALNDKEAVNSDVREKIGTVDVVFVPISGEGALSPASAHKMATELQPSFIVPLYDGDTDALQTFLKEEGKGAEKVEQQEKLVLKKKDIGGDTQVVVLGPQSA
ncbi:MAG: MBL fold metallo-hydrolase [bacterium]|nr:MBL fold metallo-hydrolase [bacterium]